MVTRTQSNNRLEREKDHIQQRTMYDRISQQFACCICDIQSGTLEENLITMFSEVQAKEDQSVKVKKLSPEARVPTQGSVKAAGHDLYANEGTEIPAGRQVIVGTGIAIQLPHNTYGHIAPGSGLAGKDRLATNAGVIGADYRGEVKVVLVNQGNHPYQVERGDRIAQLINDKINNEELQEVAELDDII